MVLLSSRTQVQLALLQINCLMESVQEYFVLVRTLQSQGSRRLVRFSALCHLAILQVNLLKALRFESNRHSLRNKWRVTSGWALMALVDFLRAEWRLALMHKLPRHRVLLNFVLQTLGVPLSKMESAEESIEEII